MMARIASASYQGIDASPVEVEVDVSRGLPRFTVVGLPDQAVKEAKERVRAAIKNSGLPFPSRKITVNLAPANVKKEGPSFDLPIALGILAAIEVIPHSVLERFIFLGELALDGSLRRIRGAIVLAGGLKNRGLPLIIPEANAMEASLEKEVKIFSARHLKEIVDFLLGRVQLKPWNSNPVEKQNEPASDGIDFSEVRGQALAKRAVEIAVSGNHNLLLIGPPGSGKTMLAQRIPTLFPPLLHEEALEVTKIYSVAGLLPLDTPLVRQRPFRAPHCSISEAALSGGGSWPRPGEISLAHRGVLFLDEFPEFHRDSLESLRSPLEEGQIRIARAKAQWAFPARFLLVCAMNPCPCGWLGDSKRPCRCSLGQIQKYQSKISGPILDRIDLHVEVSALPGEVLTHDSAAESSAVIRSRILSCREIQSRRFGDGELKLNAQMHARDLRQYAALDREGRKLIEMAMKELHLSARAFYKILKIARTIADLAAEEQISSTHLAEAIHYRLLDRQWNH